MSNKSFKDKQLLIRKNRQKDYKESLRLEGITPSATLHGKTKAEIISYVTSLK